MSDRIGRWRTLVRLDTWLRTPMIVLSMAWLAIVLVELTRGSSSFLTWIGTAIWAIFILEFVLRFTLAPAKMPFLRHNWLTVVALLVPALRLVRVLSVFRAARALRGLRLVRIVGTANRTMNALRATLRRRQFGYVMGLTLLVAALGAAGLLSFEPASPGRPGFTSYGHALWWTGMLIASIGSDFWPQTTEGRVLTSLLSVYGLAMFGYITATFASYFVGRDAESQDAPIAGAAELKALRQDVRGLTEAISRLQKQVEASAAR